MNDIILVAGHKSPDTDSIGSAIAGAYFQNQLGYAAKPVRAGEINKETAYALDYFGVEVPCLVERFEPGQKVILVDHNETKQSIDGVKDVDIVGLIDHHRLGDFETDKPVYILVEPVGCTATIWYSLFVQKGIEIPKEVAGMMLSAIISDTLLFSSPTCTERDKKAANALATLAEVNSESYGLEMLKAGADISDLLPQDMIQTDKKEFSCKDGVFTVAQLSVMDIETVLLIKQQLIEFMEAERIEKGYIAEFLMVTDILNNNTSLLFVGDVKAVVDKAFETASVDGNVWLPGVVSRKKQIIPPLLGAF